MVNFNQDNQKGKTNEKAKNSKKYGGALENDPNAGRKKKKVSGKHSRTGKFLYGLRRRKGKPENVERVSEDTTEEYSSTTRFLESSLGIKSYAELAPYLAKGVERVMAEIIDCKPTELTVTPDLICKLHKDAFGELFPSWAGISGDMVLGALIDSGLDVSILRRELAKLPLGDYSISASKDERHHITGTNIKVRLKESGHHRTFKEIKNIINKSSLTTKVKVLSTSIFENLAKAEAKVHGCRVDDVHFHEVGAIDSIVDIVGTAIGIEKLGIGQVYASPLPLGSGWVKTSHGRMPVPAPATLELLKGVPVASSPVTSELTTPTGAAIIKTLSLSFGNMPHMEIEGTGYGIGDRSFKEIPNILRLIIGMRTGNTERLIIVETNMDDMNPQIYEYLMSRLFKNGALDVFLMPIQMKKGRPAILLKVHQS